MGYYLAIDIGKTEVRHMLGYIEKDKLQLEEIYRFENQIIDHDGEKCLDLIHMFKEIKAGIKRCREIGRLPIFVGIDTWGEDFVLLDLEDNVIGNTLIYDQPKQSYNTINQLRDIKEKHPDYLDKAKTLLMLPDYLNFLLTGNKLCEYTMATKTEMVSTVTGVWDTELIGRLGYSRDIFQEIRRPGTVLGNLIRTVTEEVGYDCIIVLPATCAVSSAIFAIPPEKNADLYNRFGACPLLRESGSDTEYSAAAIGNILVQMIISHELKDVQAARECVENSFELIKRT